MDFFSKIIAFFGFSKQKKGASKYQNIDDKFNAEKKALQEEVDRILEKISKNGMNSLSKREKNTLETFSKK